MWRSTLPAVRLIHQVRGLRLDLPENLPPAVLTNFGIIKNVALTHSYYFAIFTTTFAAGIVYWGLSIAFPPPSLQKKWSEPKGLWDPDGELGVATTTASSSEDAEDEKVDMKGTDLGVTTDVLPALENRP